MIFSFLLIYNCKFNLLYHAKQNDFILHFKDNCFNNKVIRHNRETSIEFLYEKMQAIDGGNRAEKFCIADNSIGNAVAEMI